MKTRNGFVSNSSSSSFIIYGVKVDKKKLVELCGAEYEDESLGEFGYIIKKMFNNSIDVEASSYDSGENEAVLGKSLGGLEEGCISEVQPPSTDQVLEILEKLNKLPIFGSLTDQDIKTYASFTGRDG